MDATSAFSIQFSMLPVDASDEQVLYINNLYMRIQEFALKFEQYDMGKVFNILSSFDDSAPNFLKPATVNLLEFWEGIDEISLSEQILFLHRYGQIEDVQSLDWSIEFQENSCEETLLNKS